MPKVRVNRREFLEDRQGKTFVDVVHDSAQPFEDVLEFFDDVDRQRRMEEAEIHHDRSPLAGVVRELEALPAVDAFLCGGHQQRSARFRQAVGVLVRMIMEGQGWRKTGRKGSLGVRAPGPVGVPAHNTGGLAFWFLRAERYERADGAAFQSVRDRCADLGTGAPRKVKIPKTTKTAALPGGLRK